MSGPVSQSSVPRLPEPDSLSVERTDPSPLRGVERAIGELRRGAPVIVEDAERALLAVAVDGLTKDMLALATRNPAAPARLLLTGRRAAALSLGDEAAASVGFAWNGSLDLAQINDLVDPLAVASVPPLALTKVAVGMLDHAVIELTKLALLLPAAIVSALDQPAAKAAPAYRHMMRIEAAEVLAYRRSSAGRLSRVSQARVPLAASENTEIVAFRAGDGGADHLAIVIGAPTPDQPPLTRLHSACLTGDLLGSLRCDCGDQLRGAIDAIAAQGSGILLYLAQEGRGIGIANKLRAYRLQDAGVDTIDANQLLGFEADERTYLAAAEMLRQLGFAKVRLLTNNPAKVAGLEASGIEVVERVPHVFPENPHNSAYLRAKATRAGHLF
jgi:GTP cyclohydrolase II